MPKIDRHIEKDKKLLARDRKARLVTHLDLKDPDRKSTRLNPVTQ